MPPPAPIESGTGEPEYEVDHIKDHRRTKRNGVQYLMSWLSYPPEEDSWEPAENLTGAQEAIDDYWKKENQPQKASTSRVSRSRAPNAFQG